MNYLLKRDFDSLIDYCFNNPLEIQYVKTDLKYYLNKKTEITFLDLFLELFRLCPSVRSYLADILVDLFYNLNKTYNLINYYNLFVYEKLIDFDTACEICHILRIEINQDIEFDIPLKKSQHYYIVDYKIYD